LHGRSNIARWSAALASFAFVLSLTPSYAQGVPPSQSPPWLDPALLPAAKAEGSLTVYSSTNEQEGLPLFKLFTDATGIKVDYVRASDELLTVRVAE
jgi:hypothetical protein